MSARQSFLRRLGGVFAPKPKSTLAPQAMLAPAPALKPDGKRLIYQIAQQTERQIKAQLRDWEQARQSALSTTNPDRYALIEVYNNFVLDNHLSGIMDQRKEAVQAKPWRLVDASGKEADKAATRLLDRMWFYDLLGYAIDSIFWGHSLIELSGINPLTATIDSVQLVPRRYVLPLNAKGQGVVMRQRGDANPIVYRDEKGRLNPNWQVIEVGNPANLGLLDKASHQVISKKNAEAAMSQLQEIIGIPIRTLATHSRDDAERREMLAGLRDVGRAAFYLLNHGDEFNIYTSAGSDPSGMFISGINKCNSEMSKLILGQTMTTDNGSSKSQAEVHERVADRKMLADMRMTQDLVNDRLLPLLVRMGLTQLANLRYEWDYIEQLSVTALADVVVKLSAVYDIEPEYIARTTGIPVKQKAAPAPPNPNNPLDNPPADGNPDGGNPDGGNDNHNDTLPPDPQKPEAAPPKKPNDGPNASLQSHYATIHMHVGCGHAHHNLQNVHAALPDGVFDEWVARLYAGKMDYSPQYTAQTFDQLRAAVESGYKQGGGDISLDYDTPDAQMLSALNTNLHVFSGAKTIALYQDMAKLLTTPDGKQRSFADFRDAVQKLVPSYNDNWLRTEYNLAEANAQMAAQWVRVSQDSDIYDLRYETAQDDRVRDSHKALHGATFPATHGFWKRYYPPNGWGCRCDVVQVPKIYNSIDEYDEDERTKFGPAAKAAVPKAFRRNVGLTGQIFPDWSHGGQGYFDVAKIQNVLKADAHKWGLPPTRALFGLPWPKLETEALTVSQAHKWVEITWMDHQNNISINQQNTGLFLSLTKQRVVGHVLKAGHASRATYIKQLPKMLNDPDEIFLIPHQNGLGQLFILKFYEGGLPLLALFDMTNKQEWVLNTFYLMSKEEVNDTVSAINNARRGILIYKK